MDTDTNIVTQDSLETEQDIIKRLDSVIEGTLKTHEILEAKAKFGFTILSSAMALVLFAFANVSGLATKVSVDAIRLFVIFDLLAAVCTLAVMWPRVPKCLGATLSSQFDVALCAGDSPSRPYTPCM